MRRTLMRTEVVRDAHGFLRAKCTAHADCIAAGMMVEQLTRDGKIKKPHLHKRHLFTKREVFRLNENFTEHLKNRDAVDGTNLAIQWKLTDKIHGPRSGFPEKNGELEPLPWCKNVVTEAEAAEAAASDATERAIVSDATSIEEADVAPPADLTGTATALSLVSDLYGDSESDEDETASTTEVAGPCFWA
jgi:ribosomal protein L35